MDAYKTLRSGDVATHFLKDVSAVDLLAGSYSLDGTCLPPFAPQVCDFLGALSKALRLDPQAKQKSDLQTFAFWCRPAGIKATQRHCSDSKIRLGRGLTFHIAPGNIPINTAFSLAFGLLAGTTNIVRAPSRQFEEIEILCRVLNEVATSYPHQEIAHRFAVIRYAKDRDLTEVLSRVCAARVIWGGDATITHLRSLPTRAECVDVVFPHRFSLCIMAADIVRDLNESDLGVLARAFFNDAYTMDQHACSSPYSVIWCGDTRDQQRFWKAISHHIAHRKYTLCAEQAVSKVSSILKTLSVRSDIQTIQQHDITLSVLDMPTCPPYFEEGNERYGTFFQTYVRTIDDLAPTLSSKVQTLTYFGFESNELQEWIFRHNISGISRIVPVGQALDMGAVWDGVNVVAELSRIVDLR